MIDQACIEQVKRSANVVDIIGKYIKLKKEGVNFVGSCPFHNEKSPSFTVSGPKNMYKCFGCSAGGDSIEFIMKHQQKTYIEAITIIAEHYNITITEEVPQEKKVFVKPIFRDGQLASKYLNWFQNRGISPKTIEEMKVTQAMEWMPKAKKETETICFNYFRNGAIVNIKYRAADKDFKLVKDAERIFYNLDAIKETDYAIVVEGEIDALSVYEAGIKSVVSVPNGASKGNQNLDYLNTCWEDFAAKKTIVLMVDNDECGLLLRDELGRRFGYDKCLKVIYPDGCKDANDILVKLGKVELLRCIKGAVEFPIEGVFSMDDMSEDVQNYYDHGYPKGIRVGIPNFDDHLSFMLGQFTTITGIPGHGKSEFLDYILTEAAKNHGWGIAVCSFENQPSSLHVTKIIEKYIGKSFAFRFVDEDRISQSQLQDAKVFISEYFHFINVNKVDVTLDGILAKAKELIIRRGIKALVIDPWNYVEHKIPKGLTETQYTSECLTKVKAFTLTHGVHIFLVAHPVKMPKIGGKYEVPTLYNINGSGHFFNKTDNGITVFRDYSTNNVDIHIQKVRYSWLGKIGYVSFTYDMERRQYRPIDPPKTEFKSPSQAPVAIIPENPAKGIYKNYYEPKSDLF